MIEYSLSEQAEIPPGGEFSVKVIGVGGAGANVLDRMALEGSDEADLLTLNTDVRALSTSVSTNKLQLGTTLLKGMGAGGDPELGRQAALEAIDEIRESVRGYKMAFVCVGLGGGTGSGAAPEVCRVAKEEGVFLVVFATLPFSFEGKRRLDQALESLDRIGDYANAVVTFENDRMGELIVPKDGVQQAFAAADKIISQSIRATTGIVSHPGIIRIGMDELLSALDTKKSRCLFGFGQAKGDNRAHEALEQALKSPLLDKGKLLADAKNVLIHVGGGDGMTLFEVELVMQELAKHIDENRTQILFGTGTDKSLGSSLTVTVISSLEGPGGGGGDDDDDPPPRRSRDEDKDDPDSGFTPPTSTSPLAGAVEALEGDETGTEAVEAVVEEIADEPPPSVEEAAAEEDGEATAEETGEAGEEEAEIPDEETPTAEDEPPPEEAEVEAEAEAVEVTEAPPAEVDGAEDTDVAAEEEAEAAAEPEEPDPAEEEPEDIEAEAEAETAVEEIPEPGKEPEAIEEEAAVPDGEGPETGEPADPEPKKGPRKVIQAIPKRKPVIEAPRKKKRPGKLNVAPVPPKAAPAALGDTGAWSDLESPDSIGKLLQEGKKANQPEADDAEVEVDVDAETVPISAAPVETEEPPEISIRDLAKKSREKVAESAPPPEPETTPDEAAAATAAGEEGDSEGPVEEMIVAAETEDAQKITLSRLVPGTEGGGSGSGGADAVPESTAPVTPVPPSIDAGGGEADPIDLGGNDGGLEIDAVTAQQQQMLQLEPLSKGRFAKSEPTIVDGEDMDVPTFLRKRRK